MFLSGTVEVAPDKQGRIMLPKYLKDYAGIKGNVVLVGISNRIEIWSKDKWNEFYRGNRDSFEDIAEKLVDL